jgi:two-component system, OmpR family, response regulator MtrA
MKNNTAVQTEEFTPTELRLFNALMTRPGRTQTRQSLLEQAWDVPVGTVVSTRTVDMHVKRLRSKGIVIQSIRGFGYRIKPVFN